MPNAVLTFVPDRLTYTIERCFHRFAISVFSVANVPPLAAGGAVAEVRQPHNVMSTSIRNRLPGTIEEIVSDKVVSEIVINTAAGPVR